MLPNTLERLYCFKNMINKLSILPEFLYSLVCYCNHLTELPKLPERLTNFRCDPNYYLQLLKEVMEKFNIPEPKNYSEYAKTIQLMWKAKRKYKRLNFGKFYN